MHAVNGAFDHSRGNPRGRPSDLPDLRRSHAPRLRNLSPEFRVYFRSEELGGERTIAHGHRFLYQRASPVSGPREIVVHSGSLDHHSVRTSRVPRPSSLALRWT